MTRSGLENAFKLVGSIDTMAKRIKTHERFLESIKEKSHGQSVVRIRLSTINNDDDFDFGASISKHCQIQMINDSLDNLKHQLEQLEKQ